MARKHRREFVMNDQEAESLRKKAKAANMSESQLIRMLIACYFPAEAPGEEFHRDMNEYLNVARYLGSLAEKLIYRRVGESEQDSEEIRKLLKEEAKHLKEMRTKFLDKYLSVEKVNIKWQ